MNVYNRRASYEKKLRSPINDNPFERKLELNNQIEGVSLKEGSLKSSDACQTWSYSLDISSAATRNSYHMRAVRGKSVKQQSTCVSTVDRQ